MALNYLGYSYADRGIHLDQAVDLVQKALKIRPDDGFYLDSLGWAYYKQEKFKKALRLLKRAVDLVPDDSVLREHLGDIYIEISKRKNAKEQWLKALEIDPANSELIDKYQKAGFGDPKEEDGVKRALETREEEGNKAQEMMLLQ